MVQSIGDAFLFGSPWILLALLVIYTRATLAKLIKTLPEELRPADAEQPPEAHFRGLLLIACWSLAVLIILGASRRR